MGVLAHSTTCTAWELTKVALKNLGRGSPSRPRFRRTRVASLISVIAIPRASVLRLLRAGRRKAFCSSPKPAKCFISWRIRPSGPGCDQAVASVRRISHQNGFPKIRVFPVPRYLQWNWVCRVQASSCFGYALALNLRPVFVRGSFLTKPSGKYSWIKRPAGDASTEQEQEQARAKQNHENENGSRKSARGAKPRTGCLGTFSR